MLPLAHNYKIQAFAKIGNLKSLLYMDGLGQVEEACEAYKETFACLDQCPNAPSNYRLQKVT